MALSTPQKDRILLAALRLASEQGWNNGLIVGAVQEAGLKPAAAVQAFPDGLTDLLDHFAEWGIRQMEARVQGKNLIRMKVRERVGLCTQSWLEIMTPYKDAIRQLLKLSWQPRYGALSVRHLAQLSDAIWHQCGDTATDFNYYTKRTLLSGVIVTATAFWLRDTSEDNEESWQFLSNRIGNVLSFGKKLNEWKTASRTAFKTARFIKNRAR